MKSGHRVSIPNFIYINSPLAEHNFTHYNPSGMFFQYRIQKMPLLLKQRQNFVNQTRLSASMGFRFAAFTAGSRPKITPISMENTTETPMAVTSMATGICIMEEIS